MAGTLVVIAGGFDLSVGSIFGVSGVVAAMTVSHVGTVGALLLGCGMGLGFGVVNGLLATVRRTNPLSPLSRRAR